MNNILLKAENIIKTYQNTKKVKLEVLKVFQLKLKKKKST